MELLTLLSVLFILCVAIFLAFLLFSDGDVSLIFLDKFGKKLDCLKDQVVWITGASYGIGAACALEAAKHGAKVVISARSEQQLKDVKRKCIAAGHAQGLTEKDILVLPMDMTDYSQHQNCLDKVLTHFGKVKHLT